MTPIQWVNARWIPRLHMMSIVFKHWALTNSTQRERCCLLGISFLSCSLIVIEIHCSTVRLRGTISPSAYHLELFVANPRRCSQGASHVEQEQRVAAFDGVYCQQGAYLRTLAITPDGPLMKIQQISCTCLTARLACSVTLVTWSIKLGIIFDLNRVDVFSIFVASLTRSQGFMAFLSAPRQVSHDALTMLLIHVCHFHSASLRNFHSSENRVSSHERDFLKQESPHLSPLCRPYYL